MAGETLLESLLAAGIRLPSGCRSGVCQSCLVQCTSGPIPPSAQAGLRSDLRESGHLLACQLRPESDLSVRHPDPGGLRWCSRVVERVDLCDDVFRLRLERPAGFRFRAGQYVSLWQDETVCRAYSLARPPQAGFLEFHIKHVPNGKVSGWLARRTAGDSVGLQGPMGTCYYQQLDAAADRPLLLLGTGTGLAPVFGVLLSALAAHHAGPMHLIHAVRGRSQAYLHSELQVLADRYENFSYHLHLEDLSTLDLRLLELSASFSGWDIYLCGQPETVYRLRKLLFLAGASCRDIHADAFIRQSARGISKCN